MGGVYQKCITVSTSANFSLFEILYTILVVNRNQRNSMKKNIRIGLVGLIVALLIISFLFGFEPQVSMRSLSMQGKVSNFTFAEYF